MALGTFTLVENSDSFKLSTDDIIMVQTLDSVTNITATRGSGATIRVYKCTQSAAAVAAILGLSKLNADGTTVYVDPEKIITSGSDFIDLDWDGTAKRLFSTTVTKTYGSGYKSYTAYLDQSGTDAPVATIAQNDMVGDVTLYYDGVGLFRAGCDDFGDLTDEKTFVISGTANQNNATKEVDMYPTTAPESRDPLTEKCEIAIETVSNATPANGLLYRTFIEIRVYE